MFRAGFVDGLQMRASTACRLRLWLALSRAGFVDGLHSILWLQDVAGFVDGLHTYVAFLKNQTQVFRRVERTDIILDARSLERVERTDIILGAWSALTLIQSRVRYVRNRFLV